KADPDATLTLPFEKFTAKFSKHNGALVSWRLSDARYEKDATKGELLDAETGTFVVGFYRDSTRCLPEQTEWELGKHDATTVVYSWPPKGSPYESLGVHLE